MLNLFIIQVENNILDKEIIMDKTIAEMISKIKQSETRIVAVVCAHDKDVLMSLKQAVAMKIVKPILIGKVDIIKNIIEENSLQLDAEFIQCDDDKGSSEIAVKMVHSGKAHMLMKGLLSTGTILKAVLNKEWGLRSGGLLSHVAYFQPQIGRPVLITDAALNITPDLMQKKMIIENSVAAAHKLGIAEPKVALLAAVEAVNPSMQATIDAAVLSKMNDRGQIKGCKVDGPLALDNAVSIEAANHKGITGPVAGFADILVAPNIDVGNAIYKTLAYLSKCEYAGAIIGATAPIVLVSRADSAETKFNSIVFACTLALDN